jgi:hypothetical protein
MAASPDNHAVLQEFIEERARQFPERTAVVFSPSRGCEQQMPNLLIADLRKIPVKLAD